VSSRKEPAGTVAIVKGRQLAFVPYEAVAVTSELIVNVTALS